MRPLAETSGPWVGWSVQFGVRIHERLILRVGDGQIAGSGEDADGDFHVSGAYNAVGDVEVVRRYTYCTSGPEGVGIPYLYRGRWDGAVVAGSWRPLQPYDDGGPFEMWPEDETAEVGFAEAEEALSR